MIVVAGSRRYLIAAIVLFTLVLVGGSKPIVAQDVPCTDLIERYRTAVAACSIMNNNDVCYGQVLLEALPAAERFERPRDRTPITAVDEIIARTETGAVLMYLSVGAADPVKVITVGGIDLVPDNESGDINRFTLTASQGDDLCQATPPGLLVYTESGEQGSITVNGIDIELGSIAFIALDEADSVAVTNINGTVRLRAAKTEQLLAVGDAAIVATGGDSPEFVGTPVPSTVVDSGLIDWLAFDPEGLSSITNLNETDLGCNLGDIDVPFSEELRIHEPGQECQITLCATANDVVSLDLQALDSEIDPWLDLRGPDSSLLIFSDDRTANDQSALICNQQLPVDGCYTVVARSYRNESAGRLRLVINGETDCQPPEAICEVVYPHGVNLRTTPARAGTLIKSLTQGTRLLPISRSENGRWLQVRVERTQRVGWVWSNPETVSCAGSSPTATPTPTPYESVEPLTREPPRPTSPSTREPPPTDPPPTKPPAIPSPGPTKSSPFDPP